MVAQLQLGEESAVLLAEINSKNSFVRAAQGAGAQRRRFTVQGRLLPAVYLHERPYVETAVRLHFVLFCFVFNLSPISHQSPSWEVSSFLGSTDLVLKSHETKEKICKLGLLKIKNVCASNIAIKK